MLNGNRCLLVYSAVLTAAFAATVLGGFAAGDKKIKFEQIEVQRINIVEPDGTLRMVVSNKARLPEVMVRGKEQHQEDRPYAGMLFYNNEGSENGGLVFGGHKNAKGEIVDSGGSLSFDKYDASQVVQLAGVDDRENRFAGLAVSDSTAGGNSQRRVWIGRDDSGAAELALMDAAGKKRLVLQVPATGTPRIAFLDASGRTLNEFVPAKP
ncbi:MAG TPA: hypothetical protein VM781_01945 [Candidatus Bathyarchaeia archaeon]|nr:hypothetical protein [Candidatus Bathyarchaeia archaeon]